VLKVLVAEDDLTMADMIEACLTANGYQVTGIACTVAKAVALGRNEPRRVCRRLFCLSHTTMACSSAWA
jgi:DNA-binding response OmpR family regulator